MQTRPWIQIAEDLRLRITSGEYAEGERLPSGSTLMGEYGVARQTIQNAVDQLRAEGLVSSIAGRGWFVSKRRPITRLARNRLSADERTAGRGAFLTDAAAADFTPTVTVRVWKEEAGEEVASYLDVPSGTQVLVRDRVMRADGDVVQLAASYLPADLVQGTQVEHVDTGPGGTYARLEEAGFALSHFTEFVSARSPRPAEAESLRIPHGHPVIQVTRVAFAADRPVEVNFISMASDRFQLVYQIDAR
ncbi:GntR family transcriptional regulator [Actinoalloteichus sp. AHMU CJ021]|uniref:GntR family transcriptional regulator n=1 Tax=Actinoalloteichus caeruleus DSM 43889 TaxID=1120930 RepID=A0ABT1JFI9_ACTCY|nr:GntR family transcriptional regulator [Actinoalloteichus caeruleus]AUS77429.1 GntR family transcriptional regulator [Actinoalloteichus sp. AHMU CJ021]MCP2331260.1 GntR family transcriptional regulator [Actinoalloteichus caeruleus DSM 43889]